MTEQTEQLDKLMAIANQLADVVRQADDCRLTDIFDQLLVYISKLED